MQYEGKEEAFYVHGLLKMLNVDQRLAASLLLCRSRPHLLLTTRSGCATSPGGLGNRLFSVFHSHLKFSSLAPY